MSADPFSNVFGSSRGKPAGEQVFVDLDDNQSYTSLLTGRDTLRRMTIIVGSGLVSNSLVAGQLTLDALQRGESVSVYESDDDDTSIVPLFESYTRDYTGEFKYYSHLQAAGTNINSFNARIKASLLSKYEGPNIVVINHANNLVNSPDHDALGRLLKMIKTWAEKTGRAHVVVCLDNTQTVVTIPDGCTIINVDSKLKAHDDEEVVLSASCDGQPKDIAARPQLFFNVTEHALAPRKRNLTYEKENR